MSTPDPSKPFAAVPLLLVPDPVEYAAQVPARSLAAGDGEPVAQLNGIPPNLSASVGAVFPRANKPVNAPPHNAPAPPEADSAGVWYQVLSVVRYQGSGGTVFVSTARPSPLAISRGLGLGSDAFFLPDGSTAWTIQSVNTAESPNQVRWFKDGRVITVAGDLPLDMLKTLAAIVALK